MLPIFDYGDIIFDCLLQRDSARLQRLQNSALRIILRADRRTSVKQMHTELSVDFLENRRHKHTCHEAYKCYSGLSPPSLCNMFRRVGDVNDRQTRLADSDNVVIPHIRLQAARRDFAYRGPFYWQMLDQEIKASNSLGQFKGRLYRSDFFSDV